MVLLLCMVTVSCVGTPVTFKSLVDQKYDINKSRTITADACGFQLLLLIPIRVNDRAERAYSSLIAQAQYEHVTDIKVKETWNYAFVGTVYCTVLEATAHPLLSAPTGSVTKQ